MDPLSAITGLLALYKMVKGGSAAQPSSGLDPAQSAQASQLLNMQMNRLQSTDPVHQAAMAMAMRLAPAYARNAASSGGARPSGTGTVTPQYSGIGSSPVLDAIKLLTSGGFGGDALTKADGQPGTPDPFLLGSPSLGPKGPGIDPRSYDPVGPGWRAFMGGNPGGAFYGGGVTGGGGEQKWDGKGHAF